MAIMRWIPLILLRSGVDKGANESLIADHVGIVCGLGSGLPRGALAYEHNWECKFMNTMMNINCVADAIVVAVIGSPELFSFVCLL